MCVYVSLVSAQAGSPDNRNPCGDTGTELAEALVRAGHQVTVFARVDRSRQRRTEITEGGVRLVRIPAGPQAAVPEEELLSCRAEFAAALAKHWLRERPDIVHAQCRLGGRAAADVVRPAGVPLVQALDGPSDLALGDEVDKLIVPCSAVRQEVFRLGVPRNKVAVVPFAVDLGLFDTTVTPEPSEGLRRLVAVGDLRPQGGLETSIEALVKVPGARLVIAGGPPPAQLATDLEAQRLREHARQCGVADRVTLVGRVPRTALPGLFASADVALCTPWQDPYGQVAMGAMACGLPVVGTSVGALTDTVVQGVTGLLVPPRAPIAVASALRTLMRQPFNAQALGVSGQLRAQARYGWDRAALETVRVYEQVIAERG
ncbi:glycosyltransferase [Pseudonocardiaceae bacterium YIM PH 21723]|nr:glycosyltransferase [Pseudonocardiaceae bacterium YIM PH 21723]